MIFCSTGLTLDAVKIAAGDHSLSVEDDTEEEYLPKRYTHFIHILVNTSKTV